MTTFDKDIETAVRDYVLNRMTEEQEASFEEFFLSKPDVAEMVTDTQNLVLALEQHRELRRSTSEESVSMPFPWLGSALGLIARPVPASVFASLALLVALGSFTSFSGFEKGPETFEIASFSTQLVRGAQRAAIIRPSDFSGDLGILIRVPEVKFQSYEVQLISEADGAVVWTSKPFVPSSARDALVIAPRSKISQQLNLNVFGLDVAGNRVQVQFCHYRERC